MRVALTIAGSDSGGGAGIQADLKTFHAFGVFGTCAVTAVTAQDTRHVEAVHAVPVDVVRSQIRVVVDDLAPSALKTGMLARAAIIEVVADAIAEHGLAHYVLDPVMVATSGDRLLEPDAESALRTRLLPLCEVATPNLAEAATLTGLVVETEPAMERAARAIVELGAAAALVKGGHLSGDRVVDILFDGRQIVRWERPRLTTTSTHGTGCTLSAAITAGLVLGRSLRRSVEDALDFVHRAIAGAPGLGHGHGPLNHFVAAPRDPDAASR